MRTCRLIAVVMACAAAPLAAQPISDADLAARVAAVDKELAAERAAAEAARGQWAASLEEKTKQRSALARRLFELEGERQTLETRRAERAATERAAQSETAAARVAAEGLRSSASTTAEQLTVQLAETPASEELIKACNAAAAGLRGAGEPRRREALTVLAATLDRVHSDASNVRVAPAVIWDDAGKQREVTLLSAGYTAFMYSAGAKELGIALRSPADASGFRWTTHVPPQVTDMVGAAFNTARSPAATTVLLPIDVTGRLRADALAHEEDFAEVIRSGGPVMVPIIGVGVLAVLLILERLWTLYGRNASHPRTVRRIFDAARAGNFCDAERLASSGGGTVLRVLAACLRRRAGGQHAMEDTVQEQLLYELPRLQRSLGGLSVLAAVSPLLGLLGTVTGIIQTFAVVKTFGNTNPGYMAGGISEALVTTAAGLVIAIPTLLVASVLRGRVERIIAEAEKHAAALLNTLSHDQQAAKP